MPEHRVSDEHRGFARRQRREMTRAEAMLWTVLRAGRLEGYKFKRQVPFGRYVADFWCAQSRLVVEVDGALHRRPGNVIYDHTRDAWFMEQGVRVLRLPDDLVFASIEIAVERVRQALTAPSPVSLRSPPSPSRGEG